MKRAEWEKENEYKQSLNPNKCCNTCRNVKIRKCDLACVKLESKTGAMRVKINYVCKNYL